MFRKQSGPASQKLDPASREPKEELDMGQASRASEAPTYYEGKAGHEDREQLLTLGGRVQGPSYQEKCLESL